MPEDFRKTAEELKEQANNIKAEWKKDATKKIKAKTEQLKSLYLQAAQTLERMPQSEFVHEDWISLANYYHNAQACTEPSEESLAYGHKAVGLLRENIPAERFDVKVCYYLSVYESMLGGAYEDIGNREKAQIFYLSSLETCLNIKGPKDWLSPELIFDRIERSWLYLANLFSSRTLEFELFDLGKRIFSGKEVYGADLKRLHHSILFSASANSFLLRSLVTLLHLMEINSSLPSWHPTVKAWFETSLSDKLFKQMRDAAEKAYRARCQPLTLLNAVGSSTNFQVALVDEINELKASMQVLRAELQETKAENARLKENSAYKNKLTVFEEKLTERKAEKEENSSQKTAQKSNGIQIQRLR